MDRVTVYRDQQPYETDILLPERLAYEALGLFALDVLGATTVFGGLACTPTTPASLNVRVGPGRIYTKAALEAADWGKIAGTGGLNADVAADHQILKQGILRDTQVIAIAPPGTVGQSIKYLIEGRYETADTTAVSTPFYNPQAPNSPINAPVSRQRLDKAVVQLKAGVAATTGAETAPAVTAGWIPLWVITVAYGATTITAPNIVAHVSAPAISIGGGGGGGAGLSPWTVVNGAYTAVVGDRLIGDTTGGAFTVTLPVSPVAGDEVSFKGNFATNNLTINRNGNTSAGDASNLILNKNYLTLFLVYDGATWRV